MTHDMLRELVAYRELLRELTRRDLLLRYKQTLLGATWAFGAPVATTLLYFVTFTRVAPLETGVPYLAFAYVGLTAWNFSASALRFAALSLTSNVTLVTKVYCPREVFPLSAVAVALVDFAVAALLFVPLLFWYRLPLTRAAWLLPAILAAHVALTSAVALLVAMANLFYRDVKYVFELALTAWMFASSVVYPVDRVGGRLARLLSLNPMAILIDAYRRVLLEGHVPDLAPFLLAAAAALALLVACWGAFHRAEYAFAERI
jgi:ABC-2 type transport system permease protein/lipopolysaccharide transport system permease protein